MLQRTLQSVSPQGLPRQGGLSGAVSAVLSEPGWLRPGFQVLEYWRGCRSPQEAPLRPPSPEISTTACSHRNGIWSPCWTVRPQGRGGSLRSPPQLLTSTAQGCPYSRCRGPGRLPRSDPRPDMDSLLHLLLVPSAGPGSPLTLRQETREEGRDEVPQGPAPSLSPSLSLMESPCLGKSLGGQEAQGSQGTNPAAGVVWGAIGGAGVMALVALGLCLTFSIVKSHRRKAARLAEDMSDTHPALQPASMGCRQEPPLPGPADSCSSSGAGPGLGQEQELHYATLSFHGASRNVHGASPAGDTSTQYSEIRAQGGTSRSLSQQRTPAVEPH
ncbi:Hypothetical predicted protein [Marmota monax]|uniref:Uncharacterized protein n=1 Tax=Marmota monax TaxID=9995 RepID=A0A5E4BWB9_MARMO|nr:Hypothetical predicted protein [Marmota monax]